MRAQSRRVPQPLREQTVRPCEGVFPPMAWEFPWWAGRARQQRMLSLRCFSSCRLRLGMSLLGGRVLNGCVDFTADQNRKSSYVKPQQQNDESAQGAINA